MTTPRRDLTPRERIEKAVTQAIPGRATAIREDLGKITAFLRQQVRDVQGALSSFMNHPQWKAGEQDTDEARRFKAKALRFVSNIRAGTPLVSLSLEKLHLLQDKGKRIVIPGKDIMSIFATLQEDGQNMRALIEKGQVLCDRLVAARAEYRTDATTSRAIDSEIEAARESYKTYEKTIETNDNTIQAKRQPDSKNAGVLLFQSIQLLAEQEATVRKGIATINRLITSNEADEAQSVTTIRALLSRTEARVNVDDINDILDRIQKTKQRWRQKEQSEDVSESDCRECIDILRRLMQSLSKASESVPERIRQAEHAKRQAEQERAAEEQRRELQAQLLEQAKKQQTTVTEQQTQLATATEQYNARLRASQAHASVTLLSITKKIELCNGILGELSTSDQSTYRDRIAQLKEKIDTIRRRIPREAWGDTGGTEQAQRAALVAQTFEEISQSHRSKIKEQVESHTAQTQQKITEDIRQLEGERPELDVIKERLSRRNTEIGAIQKLVDEFSSIEPPKLQEDIAAVSREVERLEGEMGRARELERKRKPLLATLTQQERDLPLRNKAITDAEQKLADDKRDREALIAQQHAAVATLQAAPAEAAIGDAGTGTAVLQQAARELAAKILAARQIADTNQAVLDAHVRDRNQEIAAARAKLNTPNDAAGIAADRQTVTGATTDAALDTLGRDRITPRTTALSHTIPGRPLNAATPLPPDTVTNLNREVTALNERIRVAQQAETEQLILASKRRQVKIHVSTTEIADVLTKLNTLTAHYNAAMRSPDHKADTIPGELIKLIEYHREHKEKIEAWKKGVEKTGTTPPAEDAAKLAALKDIDALLTRTKAHDIFVTYVHVNAI